MAVLRIMLCLSYTFYMVLNICSYAKYPKCQCFLCRPVSNVVPATVILMEALHCPHVSRALLEGQTWLGWLIGVMDV